MLLLNQRLTQNLETLTSPDGQAITMRIQFEIKESLTDIVAELLHSDKWQTIVREESEGLKRIAIKDPYCDLEISVDIWKYEVHITTSLSNYVYRIYSYGETVWCEYIGAFRGLLEQELLPQITPKENFGSSDFNSSLIGKAKGLLRNCGIRTQEDNLYRQEGPAVDDSLANIAPDKHPFISYDKFIKVDMPLPPRK